MKMLCGLIAIVTLTGPGFGGQIGSLDEKQWLGVFVGVEGRSFDVAIRTKGLTEIYFKKNRKRISLSLALQVRYVVEEQVGGKWVRRTMTEDSLESDQEPSLEAEKVTMTASFTGETKVEIGHEFDKSEILIAVKVVEKKTKNPVRVGVEVVVPNLYQSIKAEEKERDVKKMIKGYQLRMVRSDGEKIRLAAADLCKTDMKLTDKEVLGAKGVKHFSVESDRIAGCEVSLTTEEEDYGTLEPKQTKPLFHGLYVRWWPKEDKIGQEGCRLSIKVK